MSALTFPSSTCIARSGREINTFSRGQAILLGATHLLAASAALAPSTAGVFSFIVMYAITGFGLSLGYHRALAHGAFAAGRRVLAILTIAGALAFQGGPISWVGFHRAHHRFTDGPGDPHAASRGFFWSHVGWALHKGPNGYRRQRMRHFTASLERIPLLRKLERHHLAVNIVLFTITWIVLGASIALWAFPLRIVVLWHVTWLTNSFAHGAHQHKVMPRNVWWLAVLGFGEGLHANHHAMPSSPSFARKVLDIDPGYGLIWMLSKLKLVRVAPRTRRSVRGSSGHHGTALGTSALAQPM